MTAHIFISYARKDGRDLALRLKASLEAARYTVWLDTSEIDGGASWSRDIENAIDGCETLLALLSKASYESEICRSEQLRARRKQKRLIPILVQTEAERPIHIESSNYRDFSNPAHYDDSFALLRADLTSDFTAPEVRRAHNTAPVLPNHFVERPQELEALRQAVLSDRTDRRIALTALRGMGGIGKSVLANALCHDDSVRDAFPDGVFWVEIGRDVSNLIEKLKTVAVALGDDAANYASYDLAVSNFRLLLPQKSALIVLDDVWNRGVITPFLVESPRSRWLITTRDGNISAGLGATEVKLGTLDAGQALALLRGWAGRDDARFTEIADKLDYHPLALKLVGVRLRDGMTADEWIDSYDGIARIKLGRNPKTTDESIELCFDASMTALSDDDRPLYHSLGIFPEDVWIPEKIITLFWRKRSGLTNTDCTDILIELERLALVDRDTDQRAVRMHDLLHSYNRYKIREQYAALQTEFVVALGDLYALPDDYAWRTLVYHLIEGGHANRLYTLLTDYRWLQAKLDATDVNALLDDYTTYLQIYHPPEPLLTQRMNEEEMRVIRLLKSALTMSSHAISKDKVALAHQLVGRLATEHEQETTLSALTDKIMTEAPSIYQTFVDGKHLVLKQAGSSLIRTLSGHTGGVNCVALTLDGKTVVSASDDKTLRVWNMTTGQTTHVLSDHSKRVRHVALTSDGKTAVSASDDETLRVWDLVTGQTRHILSGHDNWVTYVALTSYGVTAVSASWDWTLRIWNITTGRITRVLSGHTREIHQVALTQDGRIAVSASGDTTLRMWNLLTGECIHVLIGHTEAVTHVALTSDGQTAVSASYDDTLRVWDLTTGLCRYTYLPETRLGDNTSHIVIGENGQTAVLLSENDALYVWNIINNETLHTLSKGSRHKIHVGNYAVLTTDSNRVVSVSEEDTLRVWDLNTRKEIGLSLNEGKSGKYVALTTDGDIAVSASSDGKLRVWDLTAKQSVKLSFVNTSKMQHLLLTQDRNTAIFSMGEVINICDCTNGDTARLLYGHKFTLNHIVITVDGHTLVSASKDTTLRVWNFDSGETIQILLGHMGWVNYVALTPDGQTIVSSSSDKTLRVWNLITGQTIYILSGHTDSVNRVVLTSDGETAVSASQDGTLRVWKIKSGQCHHVLKGHTDGILHLTLTPNNQTVVSASQDATLRVWNIVSGQCSHVLEGHSDGIWHVALTPDGQTIVSNSFDRTLRVWDIQTGQAIGLFEDTIESRLALAHQFPQVSEFDGYKKQAGFCLVWERYSNRLVVVNPGGASAVFYGDDPIIDAAWLIPGQTLIAGDDIGRVLFLRVQW